MAGSFLPEHLTGNEEELSRLDCLVVQELFETETTSFADVVLPAASYAEVDGTFTNNDGFVQRVRQSIPPVHQAKPDWVITSLLAKALGVDFDFQMSASRVFQKLTENVPAYTGLRYPLLKDESKPVQAAHQVSEKRDMMEEIQALRKRVDTMDESRAKEFVTPVIGHELFKTGTLTEKTPEFHLLEAGNPEPDSVLISPLYQITIDSNLRREEVAVAGD